MNDVRQLPVGAVERAVLLDEVAAGSCDDAWGSTLAAVVSQPLATVHLLRHDAAGSARATGWWSPAGLLLQRDGRGASPYVLVPCTALPEAVLRALFAGRGALQRTRHAGSVPAPSVRTPEVRTPEVRTPEVPASTDQAVSLPVEVGSMREILAVARGEHRAWIRALGADEPHQLALLRWDILASNGSVMAARALLTGPGGVARLGAGASRRVVRLEPTDETAERDTLAVVTLALRAAADVVVAEAAGAPRPGVFRPRGRRCT